MFQLLILTFLVYNSIDDELDIDLCIKSIAIGGFGMCLYALFFYGINHIINAIKYGFRLGGEINQANFFGYYAALTFILFIYYAIFNKKRFTSFKYYTISFFFHQDQKSILVIVIVY